MEIISTIPLLIFFLASWLCTLLLAIFSDEIDRKVLLMGLSMGFIAFIIAFSVTGVYAVEFDNTTNTTILGTQEIYTIPKIAQPFVGLFMIQGVLLFWWILQYGVIEELTQRRRR